jgi:hypothetical protein
VPHVEQNMGTLPRTPEIAFNFSWVRGARSFVSCVMVCRSVFALLSSYIWPLHCLSIFDLPLLITPLISSNFSYILAISLYGYYVHIAIIIFYANIIPLLMVSLGICLKAYFIFAKSCYKMT